MHIFGYRLRNVQWKCHKSTEKVFFMLAWGGFWIMWKRVEAQIGRWKHIFRICRDIANAELTWCLFTLNFLGSLNLLRIQLIMAYITWTERKITTYPVNLCIPLSVFWTCHAACCQGNGLFSFRFVMCTSFTFNYSHLIGCCLYLHLLTPA